MASRSLTCLRITSAQPSQRTDTTTWALERRAESGAVAASLTYFMASGKTCFVGRLRATTSSACEANFWAGSCCVSSQSSGTGSAAMLHSAATICALRLFFTSCLGLHSASCGRICSAVSRVDSSLAGLAATSRLKATSAGICGCRTVTEVSTRSENISKTRSTTSSSPFAKQYLATSAIGCSSSRKRAASSSLSTSSDRAPTALRAATRTVSSLSCSPRRNTP
mmetsp:Transcript_1917/g.5612  ORF Transcript_1917/g.5612 Transcript_1917/m.5612 type:complete len:224 (+) Transcript_1917:1426-2097(+)